MMFNDIPLTEAQADPEKAAECLRRAAAYLRSGKPMPSALAMYLADAFEAAMLKPIGIRAKALALELNLSALNRRPVNVDHDWLGEYLDMSETSAKKLIAEEYGISQSKALHLLKFAKAMRVSDWKSNQVTGV
jgi:hypothetical protein